MPTSDAMARAIKKYQAENVRQVMVKVNKKTMPEIYRRISEVDNIQGYILGLIRADIEKSAAEKGE